MENPKKKTMRHKLPSVVDYTPSYEAPEKDPFRDQELGLPEIHKVQGSQSKNKATSYMRENTIDYFNIVLTEELCLLEIDQLATTSNIYWILLEAENALQRVSRLQGQMKTGDIDLKTAQTKLGELLSSVDFGEWDSINVKGQWQDLLKAHKAGKVDQATLERRLKEIKRDAFLYNTIYAIGRALWKKFDPQGKQSIERMFRQDELTGGEYDDNKRIMNWQPTGNNMQRAQDIAHQLVKLVGHRQALALLKNAA